MRRGDTAGCAAPALHLHSTHTAPALHLHCARSAPTLQPLFLQVRRKTQAVRKARDKFGVPLVLPAFIRAALATGALGDP